MDGGQRIGVACIVVRDGRVLMLRRRGGEGDGCWGLPGGRVEPHELPDEAAARELKEEVGLSAVVLFLSGFSSTDGWVTAFYRVVDSGVSPPANREPDRHSAMGWFLPGHLPAPLFPPLADFLRRRPGAMKRR